MRWTFGLVLALLVPGCILSPESKTETVEIHDTLLVLVPETLTVHDTIFSAPPLPGAPILTAKDTTYTYGNYGATANTIILRWGKTQAVGYKIYRSTAAGGAFTALGISYQASGDNLEAYDYPDVNYTLYYYKVSGIASDGTEGPFSNVVAAYWQE